MLSLKPCGDNMWKKICAVVGAILAAVFGFFSWKMEKDKRINAEKSLKENEEKLRQREEELRKEKEKEKKYADYKKETEDLMASAISGDPDAALNILHNASEAGKKRNSRH